MTDELALQIVTDILNCGKLIDVEKSDTLVYLFRVYPKVFENMNLTWKGKNRTINEIIEMLD